MLSSYSFLKALRLSSQLAGALSQSAVYKRMIDGLNRKAKPLTKLHLLRIVKIMCEHNPQHEHLPERFDLFAVVDELSKQDDAVLVRQVSGVTSIIILSLLITPSVSQLAKEISTTMSPSKQAKNSLGPASAIGTPRPAVVRRSASEMPVLPVAIPAKPDHQKHKRKISRNQLR